MAQCEAQPLATSRLGRDIVTAQDPSGSSDLRPCADPARFICCIKSILCNICFHEPAAVEILAPPESSPSVNSAAAAVAADALEGSRPVCCRQRL